MKNLELWTKVYLGFYSITYALLTIAMFVLIFTYDEFRTEDILFYYSAFVILIGFILSSFFTITYILLSKPTKLSYTLTLVAIGIGFGSILTLGPCIILLINWIKEDIRKQYWN